MSPRWYLVSQSGALIWCKSGKENRTLADNRDVFRAPANSEHHSNGTLMNEAGLGKFPTRLVGPSGENEHEFGESSLSPHGESVG
jgi:hypothetical protein